MRYFKFALAAGASIVVAARLSPAHALPPVYPLDANGPIRQGNMCIVPEPANWQSLDTGYGYTRFHECGPHRRAHREAHTTAHGHAGAVLQAPSYHHLDINGPIRQGRWCIAPNPTKWETLETGYGYGYFYECAPVWTVGGHHHHHGHHARRHHHHQHHQGHRRHALHLDSPATQDLHGMIASHADGREAYAYAIEQDQQSWQTIADADRIEVIVYSVVNTDGGIGLANEKVTGVIGSDVIIGNNGNDRLQGDGGLPAQLVEADHQPAVSLEWIRIAAGEQVSHSMMHRETGERIVKVPFGSDQRHAPIDPMLSPLSVLGQRGPRLQMRREEIDAGQMALTRGDYGNPLRSEADGGMSITTTENGFSPIAAVLGLVVALAAPIALVATQVPWVDKAAAIDTVSDPIAETEWYVPLGNKLTIDQRMTSTSSLVGLVAPIKSAGLTATF